MVSAAARVLELAAQAADARVDRAVEAVVVDAAHHAQDLVARDHGSMARGEQPQDVEVAGGELDLVAVERGRAARAVDLDAAGAQRRLGRGAGARARAAKQGLDSREQHARLDGLHHVVVGAHLEAQHLVDVLALGGEHEDGNAGAARAHLAADGEAVLAGQHEVQHHELGTEALDTVGDREAVALDQHLVTVALEVIVDGGGEARAVLDQQDPRAAGRFRGGVSSCQGLSVHPGGGA